MDIRQLRYFIAIAEQGSFSKAASFIHVAQPALSLHVRNMEEELGTQLLFRSPKGIVPTEAGEILLRNARMILDQLAVTEEEVRGHSSEPSGLVRLGLPGTISEILSVPLITAARERYPKIQLCIAEAMSGFVLEWMRNARIDLAVIYRSVTENSLATVELLNEELVCFGPSGGLSDGNALPEEGARIGFAEIAALPLIVPAEAHGLRLLLNQYAQAAAVDMNVAIEVDSYTNIKKLVAEGFGCSVLPLNSISRDVANGSLSYWKIDGKPVQRPVHLAHSTLRPMTNAVSAIHELVQETIRDLARDGVWQGVSELSPS